MANKKIQATATLFLDTKDAQNDAKKFVNDLKQKLSEVETAADKMTVFKDMVAYIAQVDKALAALRAKNGDAFNKAFGGLDVNLKQVVEMLMGVSNIDVGNLDIIRTKIEEIVNSGKKTGHNDTFKQIAKDLNNLYRVMGYDGDKLNLDDFGGSGKFEQKLKLLTDSVEEFGLSFGDVSDRIANSFGLEGATNVGKFGQKIREELSKINAEVEEINLIKTKLTDLSNMKVKVNGLLEISSNLDDSVMSAEELITTMTELYNKLQNRELYTNDVDYYKDYVKYIEVAKKIKAFEAKPKGRDFLTKQSGEVYDISLEAIEVAEEFASDGKSQILDALDTVEATARSRAREVRLNIMNELGFGSGTSFGDGGSGNQKQVISYQKLIEKMQEINRLQDELDTTLSFGTDDYNKAEKHLETLKQEFIDLYVASDKAEDAFDILNEISVDGMIDFNQFTKLCDIISVDMTSGMSQFKETTVEAKSAVDNLSESIKKVYSSSLQLEVDTRNGNASGKEFMNLFGADGIVSTTQGVDYQVDTDTLVQQLVANLNRDIVMSLHNHANGDMSFSPSDINSFAKMYYGQGTKINGIIANGFIHTIDFNSIGQEVAIQIAQDYQDGIQHLFEAKNIAQFASFENGSIVPSDLLRQAQASNPEYYQEVIDQLQEAQMTVLRQAFEKNGAEFTLQSFGLDNIDELSTYLANVQKNTQNAIEPVEKLKNLISTLRPSADLSEFTEVFDKFKNGAIDGSQALNQVLNLTPNNISDKTIDETNQKLREQEQLWENVKIAIKNGIGEAVGIESLAETLELIEREIKEGILTSIEECIARFKEWNNISEEESLTLIGKRERIIDEHNYDTYLIGEDEVVSKEEADKLRQLSVQQEQLYQNLRSAIKGTLSDIVDVDDMTYAFDTIEKEIETGLLTTLDQCIERFKLLTGLDDKRLTSIKDDQRIADSWDYYQGNRYVDDGETVIDSSEYNQLREDLADERDRADQYAGDAAVAEDRADKAEARAAEAEARVLEVESDSLRYQEAADRLLEEKSALQRENDELREQLSTQTDVDHKSQLAQAEVVQLELLQQKLLEVKTAVDAKTQAFEEEYVTVDGVVDAEITSLQSLISQLQEVVAQINLINDGFNNINTNAPKIELKSAPVEQSGATENIHYVTDPQGRPVTMYRGIRNSYSGLVSNRYHGGTFSTDNLELAKEYAGELGKVEKVLLSMKNPLEIDGRGALWNQIEYIGDNSDEASQKLYELNASIRATKKLLADAENIPVSDQESKNILRGFITEEDTKRAKEISYWTKELKKYQEEKAAILADTSNPYGKKNTNELVEIAKSKGYDGVIFKNIIDSATGDVKDLSNVMVTFEQDQIHYLETIASTFESSITELKNHFGGLTKHISASGDEVEESIRKMVELRGKLNAGEISEDEYNAFISGNAIARDYKKLAKKSMAVPDFITGALDGDEFELKHVIQMINDMLDNMRHRVQKVAKAFGKEGVPLDQLLADSVNVAPITESPADEENAVDEVEQLNKLQTVLTEVKNAILAKTKAFVDEGDVVGQVVGKEVSALMKLAETVDSIVPKVDALSTKMAGIGPIDFVTKKDGGTTESGTTTEDKFKARVDAKKGSMTKYINDLKGVQYVTDATRDELVGFRDALDTVKTPKDLNDIIAKFEKLQTEIGILKASFEKTGLNDIQNVERSLLGSFNTLDIDQKRELEPERDAVIKQLETYKNTVLNGQKVELQAIEDTVRALREKIEVYKQANKEASNAGSTQKKNSKFGDTVSRNATAKYNSLMGSANSDQFANSKEVAAIVGEYEKAYKSMIAFRNELRNSDGIVSEADEVEFKRLTTECNEYAKALDKLMKSTMKLKDNKANPNDYMLGSDFVDNAQGRKQALTDFVKSVYDIDVAAEDFRKDWNEVVFAVDNGDGTFTQMTARLTDARNEIVALAGDTKKVQSKLESFVSGLKNRLQSLSQYFIATVGIYDVWNVIKQGIQYVRDIDNALTELRKVTNETEASYAQFLQTASKTASMVGSTVSDFVNATADFARLGYNIDQAASLAEAASVYKNVGDGITDISQASESIISTMKAFGIEANNAMGIVDRFNEVGKFIAQII